MSIKITIPNSSSDVLTFGSGNTPTAAQIAGIDSGSSNGQLALYTTASGTSTERVRVDASGNVGIGTTPSAWGSSVKAVQLPYGCAIFNIGAGDVAVTQNAYFDNPNFKYASTTGVGSSAYRQIDGTHRWLYAASGTAGNNITFTEAMRIDSSGNLLVGTTSTGFTNKLGIDYTGANWGIIARNTSSSGGAFGIRSLYVNQTPNNADNYFFFADDSTRSRFYVYSNGGIANFSANNSNLSDQRLKKNIQLAGSYLEKICTIPVKTFLYNDQTDEETNLGVIAQDVEAIAPELVNSHGWADAAPEGEEPYKSIYQTDLQYALMKCIQELKAIIDTQASTITSLTDRITALENK